MQTLYRIFFPPALAGVPRTTNEYPPNCVYKIPFATPSLTRNAFGEFFTQWVSGDSYRIELFSFFVRKDAYLDLFIKEPFIAIALLLRGRLEGLLPGGRPILFPEKTFNIFYIPEGPPSVHLPKGDYVMLCLIPSQHHLRSIAGGLPFIEEMLNHLSQSKEEAIFLENLPLPYDAWRIIKQMETTGKTGFALDMMLRRYIHEILGIYIRQFNRNKPGLPGYITATDRAIAVRDHILANLGDAGLGGLNELASQFYISRQTLARKFKELTGKTIPQFITDERLAWAEVLLNKKELRVFEIAVIVGFSETTNFIRAFKKKHGYSPGKKGF